MKETVDCSIVIPVYYNAGCLAKLMSAISNGVIARNPGLRFEVIFVDDGSGDGSLEELLSIREENPDLVKVIKLTRNFGQVKAILAGYTHAHGKCVIEMSADGQDPPSLINDMLKAHFEEGHQIVICSRKGRDESVWRRATSRVFYSIIRALISSKMPRGGFDYVLMGRPALDAFMRNRDSHLFFQGQILWLGYSVKFLEYRRMERIAGKSRWTWGKKVTYLIDGILSYSFFPIRFISCSGMVVAGLGFLYALIILVDWFVRGNPVKGWAPAMIVSLVIGGFQLLMVGILGEYLWRTLEQVRGRDPFLVEKVYGDE